MLGGPSPVGLALAALLLALPAPIPAQATAAAPRPGMLDSALRAAYKWRSIGPDRGGRSIAVTGVPGRPAEAYFGAVGGGLWKTVDGGDTWSPVTDGKIRSASVGAVAVAPSNPDVVYIGTGESCIRGNIMAGDGVYRSTDAGRTWTHVGFASSDAISKIRVHPTNPNVVFVASFGKYGAPSQERGVFKSTDGGATWKRVLFRDERTGAVDLAIDPRDPNVMYAALWEAYRVEYRMSSGGPGSGLFKSTDGGETWTEITRRPGLPQAGVVGKIGVAVSAANPRRVWALVEHAQGGLYRSDDAGATWTLANDKRDIRQRAFYYTHVAADPKNADVVYLLNVSAYRSADAGKTLAPLGGGDRNADGGTHGDYHDLWIDPADPQHLVVGNDGGGAVSTTGGKRWSAQDFPTGQFYHVALTAHTPYHVCGAQQDNTTLCLPMNSGLPGGGRGAMIEPPYGAGGSEDGDIAPDPRRPEIVYAGGNNGSFLTRLDRRTGHLREVGPYPRIFSGEPSIELKERWQWTYPIVFSPADPRVLYTASQHVWRTTDGGQSWQRISPDLTRHDPKTMGVSGGPITRDMNGPEVYATVFALGPSPRTASVLWAGSDDGLVHVTRTGGAAWANVTPDGMPDLGRVSSIDASAFDAATAYVAVKRPLLDDRAPYVFRTHDFGKSWTRIVDGLGPTDYVHVVREDPTRRGLLYAGTQHGVFVSYDDGGRWAPLSLDLPDVPVVDLRVAENSIAIATHGRGFYVLDDITALRQWAPTTTASDVALFAPAAATRSAGGASIRYWLRQPAKQLRLDVLDARGRVVRTFVPDTAKPRPDSTRRVGAAGADSTVTGARALADSAAADTTARGRRGAAGATLSTKAGLNALTWDLRTDSARTFPGMILWGATVAGPAVLPGTYTVRLTADGKSYAQPIVVRRNPSFADVTDADLRAQHALALQIRDKVSEANDAVIRIRDVKRQVAERAKQSPALAASADTLAAHLSAVEEDIYQVRNQSGQDPLNFPIKINNRLAGLLLVVTGADARPTAVSYPIFDELKAELKVQTDRLQRVLARELPPLNAELRRAGLQPVTERREAALLQ